MAQAAEMPVVHYRLGWKPSGYQAGLVSGVNAGLGDTLRAVVPWMEYPDPRRLDVRATLRDPFEKLWVRDFKRNTAIQVMALVDGSASMGYQGVVARPQVVGDLLFTLARSAYAAGDAFGCSVAAAQLQATLCLPPRISRSAPLWIQRQWPQFQPAGDRVDGLFEAAARLSKRKSLVFLISDFHWPPTVLNALLKRLSHHDVVPVLLEDPAERQPQTGSGFANLQDMESGRQRFVWVNQAMRNTLQQRAAAHVQSVAALCQRHGRRLFLLNGAFSAPSLTQYFIQR